MLSPVDCFAPLSSSPSFSSSKITRKASMKTSCLAIVLLVSVTVTQGQVAGTAVPVAANPAALPAATPYAVVSLAANSRVWEQTVYEQGPNGTVIPKKHGYTELASGLNYWNSNSQQWLESREEIDAYAGGAIAQYGQHKVIFANNLNSAGAIDLQTPDGKELKSHILGLSYYDTASGKSVLIAQTKDCQGQIIGSNQVVYADAFDGVSADVSYTYRRGSFEQDVVLQAAPPSPQTFGLNPATTALQVLTEFDAAPPPNVVTNPVNSGTSTTLPDENLNFGAMRMGLGRAFMLGQNPLDGVNVAKQWLNVNGRTILTESVSLPAIASQLNQLPSAQPATAGTAQRTVPATSSVERVSSRGGTKNSILNVVSKQRLLPSPKLAAATRKKMKLASVSPASQGLVLDYVEIDTGTDAGDYTFQSDTTYYVTGNFYVDGTSTNAGFVGFTTNLQKGEAYQISSYSGDVTGTRVTADKPIGVFAGDTLTDVPDGGTAAGNPLVQEQLPVDQWGTNVLALSFAGRTGGDTYRVLAAYSNTVVTITMTNGTIVVTNQAGQFYEKTNIDGPVEFQATKPIQVAQFSNGNLFDNIFDPDSIIYTEGDPCEILLPPTGKYLTSYTIVTLTNDLPDQAIGDFDENFLNLIVTQSAITNTLVDGSYIASTNFVAIGTSGYYGAQITITNSGAHTVSSSQPVGVEVYGFGGADAYGYFGGIVK